MNKQLITAILATFLVAAGAAFAAPLADVSTDAAGVYFLTADSGDYQLTVSGPEGFAYSQTFTSSAPSFSVADSNGQDGTYVWELVALPGKPAEGERAKVSQKRAQSGAFTISGGSVADPGLAEEGFNKAQVFTTDLITQGSACIGFDCTSSESFGFDTLRLKENNLRIHFDDTSSSASFPGNDWRIIANDSSNGGANYLAIEDSTAGKTPFKVEAGAPNNTLYVEDDGDVGVGTANPVVRMHLVKGDSPTLRLEQDGSSGFTPQSWDLAGNETNFFVRDVTNGSKLPFRIKPGAPTDALFVAASGNVGMGTDSPDSNLDIEAATPEVRLTSTDASESWEMRVNSSGRLNFQVQGSTNNIMQIDDAAADGLVKIGVSGANNFDIEGNLMLTAASSCIQLRDTDDAGDTACTALNGTLTCVTGTCP